MAASDSADQSVRARYTVARAVNWFAPQAATATAAATGSQRVDICVLCFLAPTDGCADPADGRNRRAGTGAGQFGGGPTEIVLGVESPDVDVLDAVLAEIIDVKIPGP
ncbi:hypothetical protein AB0D10_03920 [Kitasatospora sp. NPDC048545]|uniref:hypothetical protein n=1 Tax=Kitasatospora sp. NPDC048545 TaxID=3157208 RepID=UPI0033C7859A